MPARRVWHVLLVAPLAVPAFVNSFSWISLLPGLDTYGGALLVVTLSYFPFVYLPVSAALRGLDPALEETARGLGLSTWAVFRRVQLPQLRVAALGGCLLVGLHLLGEFGALQMLRFPTFTTAIYDQYRATFNGPGATMLAGVLVLLCLVLLLAELRLRGGAHYARSGRGAVRPHRPTPLGRLTGPALAALAVLVGLALVVPVCSLGYWMVRGTSSALPLAGLLSTTGTTLALAAAAAAVTTALALPTGWLAVRARGRTATALERVTYLGSSVPGIVVALALVTVSIRVTPWLYQTTPVLIAAYAILFLPRAVVNVRSAVEQAPRLFDDVAASLGTSPVRRLARITLPLLAPRSRRRSRAGVPGRGHRAHRDPAAGTHRNADAGHGVLVGEQRPGVRRRRALRGGHGPALGTGHGAAVPRRPTRSSHMSSLTVHGLTKSFGAGPVLAGVDLHVPTGSLTALLGPSGCGKTTLLRIIAGFEDADSGTVSVGDRVVAGAGRGVPARRRGIGFVPQEGGLFPHLSVAANTTFGLPRRQRNDGATVRDLLDLVGLDAGLADRPPHQLSGGQQ